MIRVRPSRTLLPAMTLLVAACSEDRTGVAGPAAASAPAALAVPAGAGRGATVFRFDARGESGSVFWYDGQLFGYLTVSRGGSFREAQTFLSYSIYQCTDFYCAPLEEGYGLVPGGDVSGRGGRRLRLATNTAANPDFTLLAGSGGPIEVEWTAADAFSSSFRGQSRFEAPGLKVISHGSSTFFSASVEGSVVGHEIIAPADAWLGRDQSRSIEIVR